MIELPIGEYRMPDLCARCGSSGPHRASWRASEWHSFGSYTKTYSISVPVCERCKLQLERAGPRCVLAGVCAAAIGGALATAAVYYFWPEWAQAHLLAVPLVSALIAGWLGWSAAHSYWVQLVSISENGKSMFFFNDAFQRRFEQMNAGR